MDKNIGGQFDIWIVQLLDSSVFDSFGKFNSWIVDSVEMQQLPPMLADISWIVGNIIVGQFDFWRVQLLLLLIFQQLDSG